MRPLVQSATPSPLVTALLVALAIAWGTTVAWFAARGAIRELYMPSIALLVAAGIALPTIAYFMLEPLRGYFRAAGLYPLTILHLWRIPAALAFFHFGAIGSLPPLFWILAGVGDFIAGCYAARLLFRQGDDAFYRSFHRFGFADFVVAVGTGLAFTLLQDPRMATIAELPMALIPLFGVGISGASHLIAFDLLRQKGVRPW